MHTYITLVIMFVYCSMCPLPPSSLSSTPAPRDAGPPEGMATNLPENEMHYYLSETKLGYIIDTFCLFNLFVFHHEIRFWRMKDYNFVVLKQIIVLSTPGWQGSLAKHSPYPHMITWSDILYVPKALCSAYSMKTTKSKKDNMRYNGVYCWKC